MHLLARVTQQPLRKESQSSLVAHTCDLVTWRATAGLLESRVQGQLGPIRRNRKRKQRQEVGAKGKEGRKADKKGERKVTQTQCGALGW